MAVRVVRPCRRSAALTVERQEHQAEHVDGRQERGNRADDPEQRAAVAVLRADERLVENLVLREEPRQERNPGNRQRADQERPVGHRQVLLQAAHIAQVLLAGERVDHGARPEEQQGLEERVGVEMEDARGIGADAHGEEHVAELRDRRVGQHALDVVLDEANRSRHERRRHADCRRRSRASSARARRARHSCRSCTRRR